MTRPACLFPRHFGIIRCAIMAVGACATWSAPAWAADPVPPEMVLLPRNLAEAAAQWIATPDAATAVRIYATLQACLADNPVNGRVQRMGQDQCPAVTAALAEREHAKKPPPAH